MNDNPIIMTILELTRNNTKINRQKQTDSSDHDKNYEVKADVYAPEVGMKTINRYSPHSPYGGGVAMASNLSDVCLNI